MPLRHVLVAGAVPVPTELERDARRRPYVHQLLRWDGVLSTVFGHVQATAGVRGDKDADFNVKEKDDTGMSRRVKKLSDPSGLPDLLQIIAPEVPTSASASPGPASPDPAHLSSSLRRRLGHIQHVKQLTRREGLETRHEPAPAALAPVPRRQPRNGTPLPSRRVSAPARPSALAARLRKISVTDTLRQVGQDLRRIADHFQLSRLMGGHPAGGADQNGGWIHPVVTMGCVIICGITAMLGRALRR